MRYLHKQEMIKQHILKTYLYIKLVWNIVTDCVLKWVSSIWMDQNYSPRSISWKNTTKKVGYGATPSRTYRLPARISLWGMIFGRPEYWRWIWDYRHKWQRSHWKEQQWRKRKIVHRKRRLGRIKNHDNLQQQRQITFIWRMMHMRGCRIRWGVIISKSGTLYKIRGTQVNWGWC